jgi:hypothetical protein
MMAYWTSFARTGRPEAPNSPSGIGTDVMRFEPGRLGGFDANAEHHCGFWQKLYPATLQPYSDIFIVGNGQSIPLCRRGSGFDAAGLDYLIREAHAVLRSPPAGQNPDEGRPRGDLWPRDSGGRAC